MSALDFDYSKHVKITKMQLDPEGNGLYLETEVTDEFKDWFKQKEGLKRWSQPRYDKWITETLNRRYSKDFGRELKTEG